MVQTLKSCDDIEALTARAAALIAAGRTGAARPLLAAARQLAPGDDSLVQLTAQMALQDEVPESAAADLDRAIAAAPGNASLRKRRAELRRQLGDVEGAARDAAEAVFLSPTDAAAKALLGILMLELRRVPDAIACLSSAISAAPGNPAFGIGLAAACEAAGDCDGALEVLCRTIDAAPSNVHLRNAAILLCVRHRDFRQAIRLAEDARRMGAADACSFGLMGHALSSLGRHGEATDAYAEALKLGPDDCYVRHLVSAAGVLPEEPRAPAEYVRAVFDGYADRFETHLLSLGYRMPGVFRRVLKTHPKIAAGMATGPVLDLGCGTGLVGLAIADLPIGSLVGVDVSPKMLAIARAKRLYASLHETDIVAFMRQREAIPPPGFDVILAADVACYFGALEDLLAGAFATLAPGGWFILSVEELLPDNKGDVPGDGRWALQRQGRYAHSQAYLRQAASSAQFTVLRMDQEIIRREGGVPVAGCVLTLQRGVPC